MVRDTERGRDKCAAMRHRPGTRVINISLGIIERYVSTVDCIVTVTRTAPAELSAGGRRTCARRSVKTRRKWTHADRNIYILGESRGNHLSFAPLVVRFFDFTRKGMAFDQRATRGISSSDGGDD